MPSVGATLLRQVAHGSRREVRDERAPQCDVEHLQPTAHTEDGDPPVEGSAGDGHLVLVALAVVDHRVGPWVDAADH